MQSISVAMDLKQSLLCSAQTERRRELNLLIFQFQTEQANGIEKDFFIDFDKKEQGK